MSLAHEQIVMIESTSQASNKCTPVSPSNVTVKTALRGGEHAPFVFLDVQQS